MLVEELYMSMVSSEKFPTLTITLNSYSQELQKRTIFWTCSDKLAVSIGSRDKE